MEDGGWTEKDCDCVSFKQGPGPVDENHDEMVSIVMESIHSRNDLYCREGDPVYVDGNSQTATASSLTTTVYQNEDGLKLGMN